MSDRYEAPAITELGSITTLTGGDFWAPGSDNKFPILEKMIENNFPVDVLGS